jgi:hypothetical protein
MIGKIIAGSSFAGTVGYVMKELSRILDAEGVNPPEVKNIIEDFKDQTRLNPRLKNTVYGHEIEMYTVEQGEKRDKRQ